MKEANKILRVYLSMDNPQERKILEELEKINPRYSTAIKEVLINYLLMGVIPEANTPVINPLIESINNLTNTIAGLKINSAAISVNEVEPEEIEENEVEKIIINNDFSDLEF